MQESVRDRSVRARAISSGDRCSTIQPLSPSSSMSWLEKSHGDVSDFWGIVPGSGEEIADVPLGLADVRVDELRPFDLKPQSEVITAVGPFDAQGAPCTTIRGDQGHHCGRQSMLWGPLPRGSSASTCRRRRRRTVLADRFSIVECSCKPLKKSKTA